MRTNVLYLYPSRSNSLLIFLTFLHASSCACLIWTDLFWALKTIFLVFCVLSYCHHLKTKQTIRLSVNTENHWCLVDEEGETKTGALCADSVATGWFVILNFKSKECKAKRFSLILPVDALSTDDYRHLRACLFSLQHSGLLA